MKKTVCALMALLLCVVLATTASAQALDNETTVVITQNSGQTELTPSQNESCFWEYPTLTAGQHRSDGVLWLFNKSDKDATVTLSDFHPPTENETAMKYLAALHLKVKADGKTVYEDTYDKAGGLLSITLDVPKGEKKPVLFELGCDFTYSGECTLDGEVIYGKYAVTYHGFNLLHSWAFYAIIGAVVVVAVVVLIVVLKKKKSEKSA